eukprot:15481171-Alexandrium_andersonii.AAC.1
MAAEAFFSTLGDGPGRAPAGPRRVPRRGGRRLLGPNGARWSFDELGGREAATRVSGACRRYLLIGSPPRTDWRCRNAPLEWARVRRRSGGTGRALGVRGATESPPAGEG